MNDNDFKLIENFERTRRDSITNKEDILDLIWCTTNSFLNIENLKTNKDLTTDHYSMIFTYNKFLTDILKDPIPIKLYHKANWDLLNENLANKF